MRKAHYNNSLVGRAQRRRTSELNAHYVCMYICMYVLSSTDRSLRMRPRAMRKRSRPCLFRSLRSPTSIPLVEILYSLCNYRRYYCDK